jgi:hypothetical protein
VASTDVSPASSKTGIVWSSGRAALAWFSLDGLMVGVMLVIIFAAAACMSVQSDTWWQLRAGELIIRTGHVWAVDPFSWTVRGAYWPNHEWASEVLFYACHALGGLPLLLLLSATLVTLTWGGMYLLCEGTPRVRALLLLVGATSHEIVWSVRPHIISLALLVVALLLLRGHRRHWFYPPLLLAWANLHAGVVFGGVVLAVAGLVAIVRDRATARHWLLVGTVSALATLVNPLGFDLWLYVLQSFGDTTRTYLREWQPPGLDWPASYPFFILVVVWVVVVVRAWPRWNGHRDWALLLLALLFGLLGFRSIRHTAFFAIAALPLITRAIPATAASLKHSAIRGVLHVTLLLGLAIGGGAIVQRTWAQQNVDPPLAPGIVAAVRGCDGRLFNTYDTGGPLIWLAPERGVFIDNRQDPYPADLLFRAVIAEQQGTYRELFQEYDIACALVPVRKPIYPALRDDPEWWEVYQDAELAVLYRSNADPAPVR